MNKRVGIIGKFGAKETWCDGQTIKTKNLSMLLETSNKFSFVKVDTCYFKKNSIKLMLDSLHCVFTCDRIFLMVSVNGMKFYLPFLYYLNKIFHRKVFHYVIGSELLDMVKEDRKLVKYLNSFSANWFEYDSGTRYLQALGVNNVSTLPNFKLISPVETPVEIPSTSKIFRFCTFSRVMEEKGITKAIEAIAEINSEIGENIVFLDIYGQVDPNYELKLQELTAKYSDFIVYKGIIDSQDSVNVLKDYYALLFPTFWVGEGLPGTIIDAFASGIPIIASDWNANKEIIHHNKQGIVYPADGIETLKDAICWSMDNVDAMNKMRAESLKAFERYTPDSVLKNILMAMDKI